MSDETVRIDDGGPAKDMTLRDHFAAQAMCGYQLSGLTKAILANVKATSPAKAKSSATAMRIMALMAYSQADAMLAARKAGGK